MNALSLVRPDFFLTSRFQLRWKTSEVRKKVSILGGFPLKDFFSTNFSHLNQIEKWPLREVSFCHWTLSKDFFLLDLFLSKRQLPPPPSLSPARESIFIPVFCHNFYRWREWSKRKPCVWYKSNPSDTFWITILLILRITLTDTIYNSRRDDDDDYLFSSLSLSLSLAY